MRTENRTGDNNARSVRGQPLLTLLELQSRSGDTPVKFQVICPQLSPKRNCGPKRVKRPPGRPRLGENNLGKYSQRVRYLHRCGTGELFRGQNEVFPPRRYFVGVCLVAPPTRLCRFCIILPSSASNLPIFPPTIRLLFLAGPLLTTCAK